MSACMHHVMHTCKLYVTINSIQLFVKNVMSYCIVTILTANVCSQCIGSLGSFHDETECADKVIG